MGNFPSTAVTVPSSIVFAPGDVTASVTVTPPDDWRDIPDSTLTFAVVPEPEYEIVAGFGEVTVNVADNDIAPQVGISFNHAEVEEGEDLILTIERIGDTRNPLELSFTLGPVGSQRNSLIGMDPGQAELTYTYSLPDDEYKSLDTHYEVTLHPEDPEFWVPTGPTTITGAILDNDPYRVGIRAITAEVDEGQILYYQVFHDGHTAESLRVEVAHSENGSAVADSLLGPLTHMIHVGASGNTRGYVAQANDGSDGDALFTIELVTSDDYEIDPNHTSASITVRDKDPLPVVELPVSAEYIDEGVGTALLLVDLTSNLPVLRTVTVDYEVVEGAYTDGIDIVESSGTLEFPPGTTQVVVEVPVVQDHTAEANEPFNVFLSNPVNATLQDGQATLRFRAIIVDDENTVSMEAAQAAVTEGTDAVFNLTREGNSSDELTVWLRMIQSAPKSSISVEEVIFPAGETTTQLAIPTLDDETRQGTYTVTAQLEYPPALGKPRAYHRQGSLSDSITVRDDELQSISLYVEDSRVVEGQPVKFTVSRRDKETTPITVTLDIDPPAGYTFGPIPLSTTIPSGSDSVEVSISTVDDSAVQDNGELTVTVLDGTGYRPVYPNTFTFSIFDNDGGLPGVRVSRADPWVDEGQDVVFTVTRSGLNVNPLDARLSLYRVRSRVFQEDLDDPTQGITTPLYTTLFDEEEIALRFPAGIRSLTVTRSTTDDILNQGNTTYNALVLAGPNDDYTSELGHIATVWVQDDDRPTVTVTAPTTDFYESLSETTLLSGLFNTVSVTLARTGDTSGRILIYGKD